MELEGEMLQGQRGICDALVSGLQSFDGGSVGHVHRLGWYVAVQIIVAMAYWQILPVQCIGCRKHV